MKNFVLILCFAFSYGVRAEVIEDSVHSVVRGSEGEPHFVKFNSGAVKFVDQEELEVFEAKLNASRSITPVGEYSSMLLLDEGDFTPSLVPDGEIKNIFKNMNPFIRRRSECSDRAHVWAWDEFQRKGTKSEKAFLFLTDTYIRRHRYKWWFHVAPMYTTASGQKIVMDYQFLDRPATFSEWKNLLVFSKRECVKDFLFNDYNEGADQTQDCYVKFEPMYYRIPGDIGARELGRPRTEWNTSEVNQSRSRAFFKESI